MYSQQRMRGPCLVSRLCRLSRLHGKISEESQLIAAHLFAYHKRQTAVECLGPKSECRWTTWLSHAQDDVTCTWWHTYKSRHVTPYTTYMHNDCCLVYRPPVKVQYSSRENDSTYWVNLKVLTLGGSRRNELTCGTYCTCMHAHMHRYNKDSQKRNLAVSAQDWSELFHSVQDRGQRQWWLLSISSQPKQSYENRVGGNTNKTEKEKITNNTRDLNLGVWYMWWLACCIILLTWTH